MTDQFKFGDAGKTRGGRPYRVLATDLKNVETIVAAIERQSGEEYVAARFANGKSYADGRLDVDDLIPPVPAVYINVYECEDGTLRASAVLHWTRSAADESAHDSRIGCIRVPLEARFDD